MMAAVLICEDRSEDIKRPTSPGRVLMGFEPELGGAEHIYCKG